MNFQDQLPSSCQRIQRIKHLERAVNNTTGTAGGNARDIAGLKARVLRVGSVGTECGHRSARVFSRSWR